MGKEDQDCLCLGMEQVEKLLERSKGALDSFALLVDGSGWISPDPTTAEGILYDRIW